MGLSGVDITIDGQSYTSDFDGLVIFETMSPGTYDYTATKEGYATHNGQVVVINENVQEFVILSLVYDVTFIVDDGRGFVEGAEIYMDGVTQITNEFGEATFTNLLNGTYDFEITMEGYAVYEGSIEVNGEHLEVQISLVISGSTEQDHFQVSIYPNPTSDFINIIGMEQFDCYIYSQSGQLLYHEKKENNLSKIDLTDLPAGLYHIRLQSKNITYKDKILIAH